MVYDEDDISPKSQMITLFLLIFFGPLGAHRFYVGKILTGIFYLIVGSTTIIFKILGFKWELIAIVAFIFINAMDLYALYSDSFTDSKGRLVIGKSKHLVYDSLEEREKIIFTEKLNTFMLVLAGIAFYILLAFVF